MNLISDIRAWFVDGCCFGTGIPLLMRCGADGKFVAKCQRVLTAPYIPEVVQQKMIFLLRSRLETMVMGAVQPISETNSTDKIPVKGQSYADSEPYGGTASSPADTVVEPTAVIQLRENGKKWLKIRDAKHAELRAADDRGDEAAAYEAAAAMMEDIQPNIDRIYGAIKAYEKEGKLPSPVAVDDVKREIMAKVNRRATLKSRLSRLKKWLKDEKLETLTRQEYEKEQLEKMVELQEIEAYLEA